MARRFAPGRGLPARCAAAGPASFQRLPAVPAAVPRAPGPFPAIGMVVFQAGGTCKSLFLGTTDRLRPVSSYRGMGTLVEDDQWHPNTRNSLPASATRPRHDLGRVIEVTQPPAEC